MKQPLNFTAELVPVAYAEALLDLVAEYGVSRQALSKWESGAAYPETEKLIRLGKLYHCSMDYLLMDDAGEPLAKENRRTVNEL